MQATASLTAPPALNPSQQAVLDELGAGFSERPTFAADLREEMRLSLEDGLAAIEPFLDDMDVTADAPLVVTKHALSRVHGCEANMLAEEEAGFPGWNVARARGTVAHKAIELSVNMRGEPAPAELVDHALARLTEGDNPLTEWLQGASEVERAELRAEAIENVTKFVECWPPLKPAWRPVTESSSRAELLGGRIELRGKVDLTVGRSEGTTAGKVLVDLKTGRFAPHHRDDLRFYALLELFRLGVPPRRLATHYLDRGELQGEDVTESLLRSAVARVGDGIVKLVELRANTRTPVRRPGQTCRWCPLLESCAEGRAHLAEDEDAMTY